MRRWTLLAPALALAALAAVPAVTIAAGQRGARDTLRVCHAVGDGAYESRQARETDFSGTARQGHGEHDADIAPPFTIEDPQPGESSSFPGRLWGDRGQRIYDAGCVATAPVPGATPEPRPEAEPPAKVRICHATSSRDNPYVSNEPEIANNGELQGGHLDHKGPVYPDEDWGDIIPPYTYVDRNGEPHAFPGYNWTEGGQAIYANGCEPAHPPTPQPLTPILECVEDTGGKLLAHFGYRNPNATSVEPPAGQNVFSPPPEQRGQPTAFRPGRVEDAFQAEFTGAALTWSLMGNQVSAANGSQRCQGSISIVKRVVPSDDPGLFGLKIDGEVRGGAGAVGDGGSTGTIAVETGRRTVSESGAEGTQLGDYTVQIVCRTNGGAGEVVAGENGTSVVVNVRHNEAIVCTITNEIEQEPDTVSPMLECVVFNEGGPDVAVWGYQNSNDHPVTIPIGSENRFTPTPADRGQPSTFEAGRRVGVVQTPFEAGAGNLVWTLSGGTATASAGSPRCTASVELRKVLAPADDPGSFQLRINGELHATGGHGATTGPVVVGIGEGTVSETAAPGTSLSDYDSSVECTRNGTVAVSVPGTKVDGAVARGDVVVCTFTNRRKGVPPPPPPPPPPPAPPPPPGPPPAPGPLLDLVVVKTASPTTVVVGGRITWTVTVTNRSTVAAADVNGLRVDDSSLDRTRLISLRPSQGTCRPFTCRLGRLAPGASATVTAITEARRVGLAVDIVRVGSEEHESNYLNNVAGALARIIGPLTPPTLLDRCRTLTAAPRLLESGRSSVVRVTARNRLGRPLARISVQARGAGVQQQGRTDRRGIARFALSPRRTGLILFSAGGRELARGRSTCRTLLGVLQAQGTRVTG